NFAPVPRLQLPPAPASPTVTAPAPAVATGHETFEDVNGPLLHGDPLLNAPGWQGWSASFEVGILVPHVKNHLVDAVAITPDFTDTVVVPTPRLSWTASPRVALGYRWDEGCGEVRLAYQSLVSEGTGTVHGFDLFGDGIARSRINVNLLDLDYVTEKFGSGTWLGLGSEFQWHLGARLAGVYFD